MLSYVVFEGSVSYCGACVGLRWLCCVMCVCNRWARSAVVARPLCKRKAPGSIPGVSILLPLTHRQTKVACRLRFFRYLLDIVMSCPVCCHMAHCLVSLLVCVGMFACVCTAIHKYYRVDFHVSCRSSCVLLCLRSIRLSDIVTYSILQCL